MNRTFLQVNGSTLWTTQLSLNTSLPVKAEELLTGLCDWADGVGDGPWDLIILTSKAKQLDESSLEASRRSEVSADSQQSRYRKLHPKNSHPSFNQSIRGDGEARNTHQFVKWTAMNQKIERVKFKWCFYNLTKHLHISASELTSSWRKRGETCLGGQNPVGLGYSDLEDWGPTPTHWAGSGADKRIGLNSGR